jgi:hypothetical protein
MIRNCVHASASVALTSNILSIPTVWGYPHPSIIKTKRLSHRKGQPTSTACRVRLVRGQLDKVSRPRFGSDSYEAPSTGTPRPRPAPHNRAPRPRSDSHEARSPTRKTLTRVTPGRSARPPHFTYPETKVRAFNAITCYHLPTWPQPGSTWEQRQCQSSLFCRPSRDGR